MKLPSASLVASIAVAAIPLIKAFDVIDNSNSIDTGILATPLEAANYHDEAPFFRELQSNCPATCSSELCDCVSQYGYAEPCALQLHNVCTAGTIADCVAEEYVFYYSNVYCPFAACRVNGQSYEQCNCDSYVNFCGIYQNKAGYESNPKVLKYCSIATCCQGETTDEGRNTCLKGSFQAEAVSGAIADINTNEETADATTTETDATQTTEGVDAAEKDAPGSGAGAMGAAISAAAVGTMACLFI